jgi:CheY-like chemotaxis protein
MPGGTFQAPFMTEASSMAETLTVLIVDDDGDYRALLHRYLAKAGHRVVEASTGREGMRVAAQPGIDAIVIDGLLPDTDGLRWLAELRGRGIRTPAVFASSFFKDIETHRRLTSDMRVAAVLQKPVTDLKGFVVDVERALWTAMGGAPNDLRGSPPRRPAPAPPVARGSGHDRAPVGTPPDGPAVHPAGQAPEETTASVRPTRSQEIDDAIDEILGEPPRK